ncbi:hypothetical protein Hypma_006714 [Hypsizygus marmoreus]|uniref:YEATS domain-containing protein n=1 Tax=Hypsizygus marmoreus TaxID=39966 RepID=A0A369K3Q4_HYPMA|nr:hypothetical protein Hypma_006714 [Hypsizygus marmoreus]
MSSRKRRKLGTESSVGEYFGELVGELDLEISLRRRLAETFESRITWALILQEALQKSSSGSTTSFKDAAFDAIDAIETPLDVLFARDIPIVRNSTPPQAGKVPRPPPKPKHVARNLNANFLYIRSSDLQPPYDENHVQTYLLRCPTCLRKTFTSLQGLLNHARISHGLEWGTHDACVRACAVVDPGLDTEGGIEVGLGPSGILPGLRSLFQMAVGAHQPKETTPTAEAERVSVPTRAAQTTTSSHLVRTLGLHEDTPALAPFLGKQATRRGIKVCGNGNEFLDIDGFGDEVNGHPDGQMPKETDKLSEPLHHVKHIWRMRFTHRNNYDPNSLSEEPMETPEGSSATNATPDLASDPPMIPEVPQVQDAQTLASVLEANSLSVGGSRFHFAARVIVMDRSSWISPDQRSPDSKGHTHKWMISVDSPSYSHHITTILQRLTVSSLSDPTGSSVLTTSRPPFVVVGTTDQPFLARVELQFSGAPNATGEMVDQTTVLEHWVELDPLGTGAPVAGDEQIVDIDLDKKTMLLPMQTGYVPIGTKSLWSLPTGVIQESSEHRTESADGYESILSGLLGKFPMTLKDVKNPRSPPMLPYKLVTNSDQLEGLVHGRRKAIEWTRARALRDAYTREIEEPRLASLNPIPLTTADVFTWLAEQGHLPKRVRGSSKALQEKTGKLTKDKVADTWCPSCGRAYEAHTAMLSIKMEGTHHTLQEVVKREETTDAIKLCPSTGFIPHLCNVTTRVTKPPMVNARDRLARFVRSPQVHGVPPPLDASSSTVGTNAINKLREADLVAVSDPQLTLAVRKIVQSLKLPSVAIPSSSHQSLLYPLDKIGPDKDEVDARLAAHATLAICTQQFLRVLINGGLEIARQEKVATIATDGPAIKKRRRKANIVSVLTPAHILRSIGPRSQNSDELEMVVSECLARIGVPVTPDTLLMKDHDEQGGPQGEEQNKDVVVIKQEEL